MTQWKPELDLAIGAARRAGEQLLGGFGRSQDVLSDRGRDIKIAADRQSERTITTHLDSTGYSILAEETGLQGRGRTEEPMWVVDPLDGTLNYARGIPLSCVSIALYVGDAPKLGVLYDFHRDECFSGIVGEGAWRNDQDIRVSDIDDPSRAVLTTGFPVNTDFEDEALRVFIARIQEFKKVRLLGSAALSLAHVACGRADAYAEDDIMLWDVGAGVALVRAAGGFAHVVPSERATWARHVRCSSRPSLWP